MRRYAIVLGAWALLLGVVTPQLHAQANDARIDGSTRDAQGLPLPDVKLVLTETRTGLERTAGSSSAGTYSFPGLNPGQYKLKVSARGFSTEVRDLTLEVNQALRLDLTLQLPAWAK